MTILPLLIVLSTFLNHSNVPAWDVGRTCPGRYLSAPCSEFWIYDTVFIGTVKKLVNEPFPEGTGLDWQKYRRVTATVTVEEVFRGKLESEVIFEMSDCYFEFVEGAKYLIYTHKAQDGKLSLQRNYTPTRLLSEAREDLDYIRSLSQAPAGGLIYGRVYDHRETLSLRVNNQPYSAGKTWPGVTIYLRSGDRSYQTISDAAGYYAFANVPAGEYQLSTDLPEHLSGSRETVRVADKGCSNVRLSIQATGEIRGRLVDAKGQPIEKAMVTIFLSDGVSEGMFDQVRAYSMSRAETDSSGSFRFVRIPSGRYHLAVNLVEAERLPESGASRHPRMFYPGVESFKQANPIVLADGAKVDKIEFKLPALPGDQ